MAEQINVTENSPHVIISQGTVPTLPDNVITGNLIANSSVTSAKIVDDTIVNANINSAAAIDVSKLSGVAALSTVGNLFTMNQATIETDATGFNNPSQCALTRSTSQYLQGSASLLCTVGAFTSFSFYTPLATAGIPVTPGIPYTASAWVKAGINPAIVYVGIRYYNGATNLGSNSGSQYMTTTSGWTNIRFTCVAPSNATHATVFFASGAGGCAASDTFYFDQLGFWAGAGGTWVPPGIAVPNLGYYADESVGRRVWHWDANNARYQLVHADTGPRVITSTVVAGTNSTVVQATIRRINYTVYLTASVTANADNAGVHDLFTVPTGFVPTQFGGVQDSVCLSAETSPQVRALFLRSPIIQTYGISNGKTYRFAQAYMTSDAWPGALPGSAFGVVPYQ